LLNSSIGPLNELISKYNWADFYDDLDLWGDLVALVLLLLNSNISDIYDDEDEKHRSRSNASSTTPVPSLGQSLIYDFLAVLLSILFKAQSKGLSTLLLHFAERYGYLNSYDLISCFLVVFRRLLITDLCFSRKWVCLQASVLEIIYICLPVILMHIGSKPALNDDEFSKGSEFVTTPCGMMWTDYIDTLCMFIQSDLQKIESFDHRKLQLCTQLQFDHRDEVIMLLYEARKSYLNSSLPISYLEIVPSHFFESVIVFCNSGLSVVKVTAVDILYSCFKDSFAINGNFINIQTVLINALHSLIVSDSNVLDFRFEYLFSTLEKRISEDSEEKYYIMAKNLLKTLRRFVKLLYCHQKVKSIEQDDFISTVLQLIKFASQNNLNSLLYNFSNELYKLHLDSKNFIEAAIILKRHGDKLGWNDTLDSSSLFPVTDDNGKLATKESIYLVCIQLFCQGQAFERALHLSDRLRVFYEATYEYYHQFDNFQFQSGLYKRIVTEERIFPSYYYVTFIGNGFSLSSSSRQYIYKGRNWEQIAAFCERMRETYKCEIITNTAPVDPSISNGDGRFLQICSVHPAPDYRNWISKENSPTTGLLSLIDNQDLLADKFPLWLHEPDLNCDLPEDETRKSKIFSEIAKINPLVSAYYRNNEISTFAFSIPIRKSNSALQGHSAREFLELYTKKILLYTEDTFPCNSLRSRIKLVESSYIKPIENAIITTRSKSKQLLDLKLKFSEVNPNNMRSSLMLRKSFDSQNDLSSSFNRGVTINSSSEQAFTLNSNPFTLALKGAICAPVNGGIPMYKSAFLTDFKTAKESGSTPSLCQELESAIIEQAEVISSCLLLHANLVSADYKPLHEEMVNGISD
jgi:dedicator of cytokinesis protein 3